MSGDARELPDGPAGTGRPVAEAIDISKAFGATQALTGVGLTVRSGSTHALVGRNGAGKSTLVSILTGLQAPDSGRVEFAGAPAPTLSDRDGWRRQVACVYQKSTIIPTLTVAENLFLNRHPQNRAGLVSWPRVRRLARELLATWTVDVAVEAPAAQLNVEQRQLVEIARALSFGARFIILDEPTAQLDASAIQRLFGRIRALQSQGVTFLFISHHLQEVYDICDTVSVLRDARHIVTAPVAELGKHDLVAAMTGQPMDTSVATDRPTIATDAPGVLRVADLRVAADAAPVSFTIRAGEVLGLAGGGGSGKVEVAESIVGLRRPAHGRVEVEGKLIHPGSVDGAIAAGVGFVPQDRHREGFVPLMSIAENVTMTAPGSVGSVGFIQPRRRDALASTLIDTLAVKASGPEAPVASLSGGNQQKVVMARALATEPKVLVLVTPTAGVDVRSKETLLAVVEKVRARGTAVLMVSDELDDLRVCDRVLVMFHGRAVAEMPRGWRDNDLVAVMEGIDIPHVADDV
jgi:simple sugar transport system ATP-binding protein